MTLTAKLENSKGMVMCIECTKHPRRPQVLWEIKGTSWALLVLGQDQMAGHLVRMLLERIPHKALRWTPPGSPETTWRRTVETELRENGLTRGEAGKLTKDRDRWQRIVAALCLSRVMRMNEFAFLVSAVMEGTCFLLQSCNGTGKLI